jgi:hypothetical protein
MMRVAGFCGEDGGRIKYSQREFDSRCRNFRFGQRLGGGGLSMESIRSEKTKPMLKL